MDIVRPLPESQGMHYLLMICERMTRWLEAVPLASVNANTITNAFLSHWVCCFGIPSDVVSDRGLQFTSCTFTSALEAMGSHVHLMTAYHLQSNVLVDKSSGPTDYSKKP